MFLLDTVILSELRKRERNPGLVRWIDEQRATDLYLSVVSVAEIERGQPGFRRDPGRVAGSFAASLCRPSSDRRSRHCPALGATLRHPG